MDSGRNLKSKLSRYTNIRSNFMNYKKNYQSILGILLLTFLFNCTIKKEMSGETKNEVKVLMALVDKAQKVIKLKKGLEMMEVLKQIQTVSAASAATTTETNDPYPGTAPANTSSLGACYIDNTGTVSGLDICCYNLVESDCFTVASMYSNGYEITFKVGSVDSTACTANGFSKPVTGSGYTCFLK